jgi:hypothetical protein
MLLRFMGRVWKAEARVRVALKRRSARRYARRLREASRHLDELMAASGATRQQRRALYANLASGSQRTEDVLAGLMRGV